MNVSGVSEQIGKALELPREERFQKAVEVIAEGFEAMTCTLHEADVETQTLHLRGYVGLPETLLSITQTIPFGKGMAGLCAERRELVSVCNLQTDESGVARPRAKETQVAGAIVLPLLYQGEVAGTIGLGKRQDHTYSEDEIRALELCATHLAKSLKEGG